MSSLLPPLPLLLLLQGRGRWHLSRGILPSLYHCDSNLLLCGHQPLSGRKLPLLRRLRLLVLLVLLAGGRHFGEPLPCLWPCARCQRRGSAILVGLLSHRDHQRNLLSRG